MIPEKYRKLQEVSNEKPPEEDDLTDAGVHLLLGEEGEDDDHD